MSRLEKVGPSVFVVVPQWHDPIRNRASRARRWAIRQTVCRWRGHAWRWRGSHGYVSEHAEMPPPHFCTRCWHIGRADGPVAW